MKLLHSITFLFLLAAVSSTLVVSAQTNTSVYQLKEQLKSFQTKQDYLRDTAYVHVLTNLAYIYSYTYPDSALLLLKGVAERCHAAGHKEEEVVTWMITGDAYQTKGMYDKALENFQLSYKLAKEINYKKKFALIQNRIGIIHLNQGNYPKALSDFYESLKAAEAEHNNDLVGAALNNIATVHYYQGNFNEAEKDYLQRLKLAQQMSDSSGISIAYNGLGEVYLNKKDPVKALQNLTIAYNLAVKINDEEMLLTVSLSTAEAYYECDSLQKAVALFKDALRLSIQMDYGTNLCNALIGLAKVYYKQGLLKEALANGLEGLHKAEQMGQVQLMRDANEIVSTIYEASNDGTNALKYYRKYKIYSDSMNNLASQRAAAEEKAGYEFSRKEIEFERQALQQRWIIFSALAALLLLAVILWLINRNRKRLNITNIELHKKNEVIETQKIKAEATLVTLKATQAQLIQSEKMASLGELTAGIAHEIQNPLNFVNNFSEVSTELIDEMKQEIVKGNYEDVQILADDIKLNLAKINHHGKRADAIVKGMLQHSRQTSGTKELTDINDLCDEYLRLSYHGLRAKDKSFNADFKTDFDESLFAGEAGIGKVNIVPQDMGRVLLNLYNNAFYAVNEKKKQQTAPYQPMVTVTTKALKLPSGDLGVLISVSDNGNGIPEKAVDKIFQPFFTTKPTGEGTGLGLSISYDIVTKEHNGTIVVKTKQGEGTTFIIQLPTRI